MADLPSILGGMAQGFVDFGKGVVDMFGTGGAAIGDLIEGARTGKVTTKNQDDFRKWLYQTDSTKDAAAKGLGTALNGVQTVLDYIPGVNVLTRNPLGNAAQGALGGLADEFKTYGEDYDLGRAGQRAAVSGAAAAASGSLADALKGSSNALLSSNTLQGLARGATGGAITGGGYAAIDGGDVLEAAKQGAGMGALIGGATGAFQDFRPAKTYNVALTDDERAARIANAQKQIDDIGPIRRFTDDPNELAKRARVNELQDAIKAYQSGYDTVQDYNDALAARRANRQPSLTREEYEAKMQQRIRDLGGNYEVTPEKQAQFDRLQKVNPMRDDYHTGIRAPQDIATLQEAINNAKDIDPAYKAMLQKALADDSVTVYSSYPIEEGVFTTPIKQMAQDYAGPGNQVYSKTISPNDIAWIDDQEGNYIPRLQQLETTLADADMAVNNPRYLTDENGNPRTFYHGTPKNPTESGDTLGSGLYITSNKDRATGYANGGKVSSYDASGLNIANLDDVIPENVAKVLRDNPELSDKLKTLTPTTETYDLAQRDAAYNRFKALKGEYPRDLIEVKKTDSGFNISYPGDVDYAKITGKDIFRKLNTPEAQDVFMRAGYDGVSKTALGGDTEMAIYRNAPQPLETTLADADMAVNNPRYLTDENGNPRTFYHGSPNKNITEFDINQAGKNTSSGEHALYFTDNPQVADDFSYERLPGDSMFIENKGAKGRVYPVNLEMNNPLDLDNLSDAQIRELWEYASPLGQLDGQEKFIRNLTDWRDNAHNAQLTKGYLDLDKLRDSQYDGFMARMYPNQDNQAREYAVFDNSKVKMLEDVLANDDMAVNNQANGLGGSPDGAQNYRTFATGDEAREYFGNSNPGYWDKAPGYDDIQEYTRNGYSRVNDMLRTGQDNYGYPDTDIMIDNIERGIDGYNLKDDIKVYRKSNADVYKNLKVGDTFTDDGFTSASVTPEIGGDFGKANIEIDVGKGKGVGAFIGDLSSGNGDEGEFLLQRGTKYKVVGKDGDKLKLEVVGNERKPLEQILANQDLSVNSAKIAPGQLGLFDDMPTQTPKTGTRQTSLFDQPDNPYLDYYGADIDATPLAPETPVISGPVDMSVEDLTKIAIDESTLPKGWKKARELADMGKRAKQIVLDPNDPNRAQNEYNVALYSDAQYGRNMPVADVIDKLGQIQYGREIDRGAARLLADQLDESGDEFAKKFVTGAAEAGGNISHYRDAPKAKLADEQLSNLLNIGRSSSMLSDSLANPSARNARGDQWKGTINLDGKSIAKGSDGGISTFGHERLHAFQDAGNMGYDQRVVDAYNELHDDLSKIYHSDSQIRKDYGSDVKYWSNPIEQEARMAQFYLEDKFGVKGAQRVPERDANGKAIRYKDDGTIADPNNLLDYYTGKPAYKGEFEGDRKAINAAFDKFRGKLQDLTRKGVALPAFLTLFGGGAYMASQENDKEKEVK